MVRDSNHDKLSIKRGFHAPPVLLHICLSGLLKGVAFLNKSSRIRKSIWPKAC